MKSKTTRKQKPIRVGVIGLGRGGFVRRAAPQMGMEPVGLCVTQKQHLRRLQRELKVVRYTDYDKFLEHDLDAVILANYFMTYSFAEAIRTGKPAVRRQYADDHWQPDPTCRKAGDPWPSILGEIKPSRKALAYVRRAPVQRARG